MHPKRRSRQKPTIEACKNVQNWAKLGGCSNLGLGLDCSKGWLKVTVQLNPKEQNRAILWAKSGNLGQKSDKNGQFAEHCPQYILLDKTI